jgi:hypothetical protein
MKKWIDQHNGALYEANMSDMTIRCYGSTYRYVVVPISIDDSRFMGLSGECDATAVLKYLDEIKGYIRHRVMSMKLHYGGRK